jgi:hypothetical protein
MKYLLLLVFIFIGNAFCFAQNNSLLQYKKYFDQELNQWTKTFSNFNLKDFKPSDTLQFENNYKQDFSRYKEFLLTYKPIITYSPDSSTFIDIYSYQLNLEKKGNSYYVNGEIDQAILLCNLKRKYWDRIYFGSFSQWIDEVVWISNTKFIMVGITKSAEDKKNPLILVGDTEKQALVEYLTVNNNSFQSDQGYRSAKLKRIKIEGL